MSDDGGWFVRNVKWLYFFAGIVLVAAEITFFEGFVSLFGELRAVGYLLVGLFIYVLVRGLDALGSVLARIPVGKKEVKTDG